MISLPQALARAVGTTNVYPAGHVVADWLDGRNPHTTATAAHYATMIRKALRQSNQPGPDDRPDTSLRAELLAELATQREVLLNLCDRVDRLEKRADGLTPIERVERRWAKESAGGDKLDRLIAQDRADEPTVPGSQRLATHPDGTPMISIGKAEDLNTIARLAADPEHARAVLADEPAVSEDREPAVVVEEPSDEELLGLDQLEEAWNAQADAANGWNKLGLDEIIVWAQRQALARWGPQPAPPVKGELAELVEFLKGEAHSRQCNGHDYLAKEFARAAELLQQRHPEPVPISERLPGAEDCDEDGRCWLFSKVEKEWRLLDVGNPGVPHLKYCFSHSLPATALPLPAGEEDAQP